MILTIENLSKSYKKTKALINFSAKFNPGIYCLLGPNGSGKSTLMNIITDNLKADSGTIKYNGTDIIKLGAKYREKIGFMPQHVGMYPAFTAIDFLSYVAVLKGVSKKDAKMQIDQLLEVVELSDVKNKQIKTFSGGMKQRLALAQALIGEPELIILDEPTAGLDPKQRIQMKNYLSNIALNKTIIIATHIISDVEYIAKEIILLKKGVIIDSATPNELIKKVQGLIWSVPVSSDDVSDITKKHKVISINNVQNGIVMRVLSEEKPTVDSTTLAPTLEDYYFYIFNDLL